MPRPEPPEHLPGHTQREAFRATTRRLNDRRQASDVGSRTSVPAPHEAVQLSPKRINSAKDLAVYGKAYELAMKIFAASKRFPSDEQYALTSQIRRSSRSVCMNLREVWAKRRYEAHFVSKLTDCDGENSETDTSLDFAYDCGYLTAKEHAELTGLSREVGRMLGKMITYPQSFLTTAARSSPDRSL